VGSESPKSSWNETLGTASGKGKIRAVRVGGTQKKEITNSKKHFLETERSLKTVDQGQEKNITYPYSVGGKPVKGKKKKKREGRGNIRNPSCMLLREDGDF